MQLQTTSTGRSPFSAYLNEIGRVPLLTPEQEIELGRRILRARSLKEEERPLTPQEKRHVALGERAAQKVVKANLRLVVNCAKKYHRMTKSMDLMDLVQEGNIGLVTAAERYDPTRGYKFCTYAYWWIRQAMTRAMQYKDRSVRLPGRIGAMAYTWGKVYTLQEKLGRAPTVKEMAKAFKVTTEDMLLYLERGAPAQSLDIVTMQGDGSDLGSLLSDGEEDERLQQMDRDAHLSDMLAAIDTLADRERDMVLRRWGMGDYAEPQRLHEIGSVYGINRESVRLTLEKACRRIRVRMGRIQAYREMDAAG